MAIGRALRWVLIGAMAWAVAPTSFAQSYPDRPIKLVVAFPAGGTSDLVTRAIQRPLARHLGGNIIVENRPGASTRIGTLEVVKAPPDGYTLLMASLDSTLAYYYSGFFETKVWEELTAIGRFGDMSWGILEVRADSPFKSWHDLVGFAKKNPGKLNAGGPATGGMMNLIILETAKSAGVDVTYVAFAGGAPAGTALLGGHIDYRVALPGETMANLRAGKTRGIAIAYPERTADFPDVPTFREAGIGFEPPTLGFELWAPPKLPPALAKRITAALQASIMDPEFVEVARRLLLQPRFLGPEGLMRKAKDFETGLGPKLEAAFPKK